jgi:hypothetical protein
MRSRRLARHHLTTAQARGASPWDPIRDKDLMSELQLTDA